jgi:hypothetical protein
LILPNYQVFFNLTSLLLFAFMLPEVHVRWHWLKICFFFFFLVTFGCFPVHQQMRIWLWKNKGVSEAHQMCYFFCRVAYWIMLFKEQWLCSRGMCYYW